MLDYKENGPTLRYNPNIRINYSDKQSNIDSNVTPDIEDYIETPYYVVNDLQNESKTIEKPIEDKAEYDDSSEKCSKPIEDSAKKEKLQSKPKQTSKSECNKSRNLTKDQISPMEGKVLDQDTCNPISGATVFLFRKYKNCDDKLMGMTNTNTKGEYIFTSVTAGIYVVKITAQGYTTRCICIAMIKNLTPLESTITLKKTSVSSNSNSCIFGIINDANKKPMCNAKVVLYKLNGDNTYTEVATTITNNCGKYTFKNVSNGNYKVSANNVDVSAVSIDGSCKRVQIYNN